MRAREDTRDGRVIEGILYLRHVTTARGEHVAVDVLTGRTAVSVDPSSLEVLEPGVVPVEQLEADDPLRNHPNRRRFDTLPDAVAAGLVQPIREREGGTWLDLFAALGKHAAPMIAAGWRVFGTEREESWEYGDSVFWDLERDGVEVELEYYEHGQLVAYPLDGPVQTDDEDEPTEPTFSLYGPTHEDSRVAFAEQGWLDP